MIGKITGLSRKELREDILHRMSALDTTGCEYSNKDLVSDFVGLLKNEGAIKEERDFLKEIHHLADCVTAKKAYQDYLNSLRESIDKRIKENWSKK